jgi:UDP-N-acetylglucosamine--N-acetylmuramyl-(pentapeptide) pyrophosphoryl-undecaprenol N-acetylglucosamine transferase
MSDSPVLLAAGGTGGHLFPAEALAHVLAARKVPVELVTDERALQYGAGFPARATHRIRAATPRGGSIASRAAALALLALGVGEALALVRRIRPRVVIGFGGYPTVPPLVAASLLRTPSVLHEANGVMGKANRFLAGRVAAIAAGFPLEGVPDSWRARITLTGNPLRPNALAAMAEPYPPLDGRLRLLVTGGSQGARVMSDVLPLAVSRLSPAQRARLIVTQQARQEDVARVTDAYRSAEVAAEIAPFFIDLPRRMAQAQLVVARAGASTVSELAAIGRASILVPLPHALDQDQAANAAVLQKAGAAEVVRQEDFTPGFLAERLAHFLDRPELLQAAAQKARAVGVADAAERLADLALGVALQ